MQWLRGGARGLPGADFVHYKWVRSNALLCGLRTILGRRRGGLVVCQADCRETETAGHIIQKCHRTHGGRIVRHDEIVKAVGNSLERKGWTVQYKRLYPISVGPRKPDITAFKDGRCAIIDAQVVSADDLNGPTLRISLSIVMRWVSRTFCWGDQDQLEEERRVG